jgi:hypothetical protein
MDGSGERVVDLKGFRFTGALGIWIGLDPTNAPILIRDAGSDDIYPRPRAEMTMQFNPAPRVAVSQSSGSVELCTH